MVWFLLFFISCNKAEILLSCSWICHVLEILRFALFVFYFKKFSPAKGLAHYILNALNISFAQGYLMHLELICKWLVPGTWFHIFPYMEQGVPASFVDYAIFSSMICMSPLTCVKFNGCGLACALCSVPFICSPVCIVSANSTVSQLLKCGRWYYCSSLSLPLQGRAVLPCHMHCRPGLGSTTEMVIEGTCGISGQQILIYTISVT